MDFYDESTEALNHLPTHTILHIKLTCVLTIATFLVITFVPIKLLKCSAGKTGAHSTLCKSKITLKQTANQSVNYKNNFCLKHVPLFFKTY